MANERGTEMTNEEVSALIQRASEAIGRAQLLSEELNELLGLDKK
jgi:hypothetical protein